MYEIEWPATVKKVEGQWLWVADEGGYSASPKAGWVYSKDVLKLDDPNNPADDAYSFYTATLKEMETPSLRWLRGICLEKKSETAAAKEDYKKALENAATDDSAARAAYEQMLKDAATESSTDENAIETVADLRFKKDCVLSIDKAPANGFFNRCWFDARIRFERLKAKQSKKAAGAKLSAVRMLDVILEGGNPPRAYFEVAEALKLAYQKKRQETRRRLVTKGIFSTQSRKIGRT